MENTSTSEKIEIGVKSQELRKCQKCGRNVKSSEFVLYKDASGSESVFCLECEALIKQELKDKAKDIKIFKPIVWGFCAMLLAAALWAAITIASGWEVGYVGIGAAALISKAILKASKQARSAKLQALAVVMTILAVFIAHLIILVYFVLKLGGNESQLLYALIGLIVSPQFWIPFLHDLALSRGPIGWLIIAITIYTAYSMTNPKVVTAAHVKSQIVAQEVDKLTTTTSMPVPKPQAIQTSMDVKFAKAIARKITGFTILYVLCAVIGLFVLFGTESIPTIPRIVLVLVIGSLSAFVAKRTIALKQQYPEQYELTQKANNRLSFKRVIVYSILGFFGLIVFIAALGFILG